MDPWWCEAIAWWRGLVQAGYSPDRVYEWAAGRWGYRVAYDLSTVAASASEGSSSASVAGAVIGHAGQGMDAQDGYNMTSCYSHGAADGHVALAAPRHGGRGQSEAEAAAEAASAGALMVPPDAQGTVRQVRAAVVAGLPPQAGEGASASVALRTETMGLQSEAGAAAEAASAGGATATRDEPSQVQFAPNGAAAGPQEWAAHGVVAHDALASAPSTQGVAGAWAGSVSAAGLVWMCSDSRLWCTHVLSRQ